MWFDREWNYYWEKMSDEKYLDYKTDGYYKLKEYVEKNQFSEDEIEEILLRFSYLFLAGKRKDTFDLPGKIFPDYLARVCPEILAFTNEIHNKKPLLRFVWIFWKKDELQADDIFNSLEVDIKKYELLECDYGAIIIRVVDIFYEYEDLENTSFFPPNSNDKEKRELGLSLKKVFDEKGINYEMFWYSYNGVHIISGSDSCYRSEHQLFKHFMQLSENDTSWAKEGFRKDLGMEFRSSWEANIARVLNYKGISWDYETEIFDLDLSKTRVKMDSARYIPDFILKNGLIIEIKGFWDSRSKLKNSLFRDQYPDKNILTIDNDIYRCIAQKYKEVIPNWEDDKAQTRNDIIQVVGITILQRVPYVKNIKVGDKLVVVREPNNEYDSRAIRVNDSEGNQIGYFAKDCNSIYAPKMDMGFRYEIQVMAKEAKVIQCKVKLLNADEMILPELFC